MPSASTTSAVIISAWSWEIYGRNIIITGMGEVQDG
jgi:hypothetical protein